MMMMLMLILLMLMLLTLMMHDDDDADADADAAAADADADGHTDADDDDDIDVHDDCYDAGGDHDGFFPLAGVAGPAAAKASTSGPVHLRADYLLEVAVQARAYPPAGKPGRLAVPAGAA